MTANAVGAEAGKPKDLTPNQTSPESPGQNPAAANKDSGKKDAPDSTAAAIDESTGDYSMRFDWDEPVAAAVFRRAGNLWIIFDKPKEIDTEKLLASGGNVFHGIEQIPSDQATVLRMSMVAGINPKLKRDGLAWLFDFRMRPLRAVEKIEVMAQPNSPVGARLFLQVTDPGSAIVIKDPEVGDNFVAVPVIGLGHGVPQPYEYPQVRILESGQGVIIKPKSDNIKVRPLRQGVEVTNLEGIQLSPVSAMVAAAAKMGSSGPLKRAFDLRGWDGDSVKSFADKRRRLERIAAMAEGLERRKARFDIVKFFLSNGFAAEAMGVMRVLAKDSPELLRNPEFIAFRGVANFLMGRYADARKNMEDVSLRGNDEGAFWLAAAQAAEGDMVGAAHELRRTGMIIQPYPKAMKLPLSMLVAEVAIEVEDAKQAERFLKAVETEYSSSGRKEQINYLEGLLLEMNGDFDGAVGKWEVAAEGAISLGRAKSTAARAERLMKLKEITRADAIEELENLRYAWRGDDFEFNLLRRLGRLYMDENDYRHGLRTLKQAVTYFPKHKKTPEVAQEMHDAFSKLYIEGEADKMPPITAIALYDEFKELSPVGAEGDKMVQKLAERLIDVDLLDRGAELLEAQVKFRLKGKEKARVGARLAQVHIMARNYKDSLQVLESTNIPDIDTDLVEQRRHLKARALIGLKRDAEALDSLNDDKSVDADLLRSNIFWKSADWPKAAQTLRRLVRAFEAKPNEPLDEKQSQYVLNLAVALALSGNERGLARARADYMTAMDDSPLKDAFRLITSPDSVGLLDYRTIASKIGVVESFQAFMASYQERMKDKSLN